MLLVPAVASSAHAASASSASTLPPGNTSAPEANSISRWRTTMNTSMPSGPSRRMTTVAAGRAGTGAWVLAAHVQVLPWPPAVAGTRRDSACIRPRHRSASSPARARQRCRRRWSGPGRRCTRCRGSRAGEQMSHPRWPVARSSRAPPSARLWPAARACWLRPSASSIRARMSSSDTPNFLPIST